MTLNDRPIRRAHRAFAAVAAAAALALTLSACAGDTTSSATGDGSDEPYAASIQLGWLPNVESGMFIYADEEGYYADEGVDATILPGGPDVAIDAQVTSGKALVGVFSTESLANAVLNGAPLVALSATYQYSANGIVTMADSGITEPEDLEGHTIGLSANDRTTIPFLTWLGLDMDTVTVVPTDGTPTALASGEVDALVSPKGNVPVVLETQGIATDFMPVAEYGYNRWSGILAVRADSLEDPQKLAAIQGIIAATQKGAQAMIDDPETVADVVFDVYGEQQGLTQESQRSGAVIWSQLIQQGQDLYGGKLTEITDDGVATAQDLLTNILSVDLDAATLFDLDVAKDALT